MLLLLQRQRSWVVEIQIPITKYCSLKVIMIETEGRIHVEGYAYLKHED